MLHCLRRTPVAVVTEAQTAAAYDRELNVSGSYHSDHDLRRCDSSTKGRSPYEQNSILLNPAKYVMESIYQGGVEVA